MKNIILVFAIMTLFAMSSCRSSDNDSSTPAATPVNYLAAMDIMKASKDESEVFTLGEIITVRGYLTNVSGKARQEDNNINFWYLDVEDQKGNIVYTQNRTGASIAVMVDIANGERLVLHENTWNQKNNSGAQVAAGLYRVKFVSPVSGITLSRTIFVGNFSG
jgi:hypothetical protein